MKKIILSVLLSAMVYAGGVIASVDIVEPMTPKKVYVGAGFSGTQTYIDNYYDWLDAGEGNFHNAGITVLAGYKFYTDLGFESSAEVRAGFSAWYEDTEEIATSYVGVYWKPSYQFTSGGYAYGLIGVSSITYKDNLNLLDKRTFESIAFGFGLEGQITEDVYLFTDYVFNPISSEYGYFEKGINFDVATVGLKWRF